MIDDLHLIKEIQARPNLYQKNLANYTNRIQREADWTSVAEKVNLSSTFCKTRWRSIRDRFVKIMKLVKDESELDSITTWRLLPHLKFLKDHLSKSRSNPPVGSFDTVHVSMDINNDDDDSYFIQLKSPVPKDLKFDQEYLDEFISEENTTEHYESDVCHKKSQSNEPETSAGLKNSRHEHFLLVLADKLDQLSEEECEDIKMDLLNQVHAKVKAYKNQKLK